MRLSWTATRRTHVSLERDPRLDGVDRYGRLIRYVASAGVAVNYQLVARGAASVWYVNGDRGRQAGALLRAAKDAQRLRLGLWGACPGTRLDTSHGVQTGAGPRR